MKMKRHWLSEMHEPMAFIRFAIVYSSTCITGGASGTK